MGNASSGGVLVTGASTGIGSDCVRFLHEKGIRVLAGVRRSEDGEALRAAISEQITPVLLDVTDPHSIESARKEVLTAVGAKGLRGLVNNAGIFAVDPLEIADLEESRAIFEVNVIGLIAVTQSFLPLIREAGGRIVNIGSVQGYASLPYSGVYSASKFAIEGITDALRRELRPWGIPVSVIEPGAIQSLIQSKAVTNVEGKIERLSAPQRELYGEGLQIIQKGLEIEQNIAIPGEEVARAVHHALTAERPRLRYRVGSDAKKLYRQFRTLPDRMLDRIVNRLLGLG